RLRRPSALRRSCAGIMRPPAAPAQPQASRRLPPARLRVGLFHHRDTEEKQNTSTQRARRIREGRKDAPNPSRSSRALSGLWLKWLFSPGLWDEEFALDV